MFSGAESQMARIIYRMYHGTAVAHFATKYTLAAVMARDRETQLSYIPTAEMLAHCFPKLLPKPAYMKQCAVMGMIRIGLGNVLGIEIGNCLRNSLNMFANGYGSGIGMAIGHGIMNAIGKYIDWACVLCGDA